MVNPLAPRFLMLSFCFSLSLTLCSQSRDDFEYLFREVIESNFNIPGEYSPEKEVEHPSEPSYSLSMVFTLYRITLSSQDLNTCNFYPSCSHFAEQSITKKGFVMGAILTMDRLSRCNGLNLGRYDFLEDKLKFYDPVE